MYSAEILSRKKTNIFFFFQNILQLTVTSLYHKIPYMNKFSRGLNFANKGLQDSRVD